MKLLFVYNADSGKLNTLFDIAHKIVRPDTYECALCEITHGVFSEKQAWKNFRDNSPHDLKFLHRDEFEQKFNQSLDYPVILRLDNELEILFSAEDIKNLNNVEKLIEAIRKLPESDEI
jgi:hypothetical protein